ncbi:MAG: gfo/Idh/MocA family oxidoreductase [Chitinivibrionales bacterium]|nr:gfo/Idh/MocA family oxidoreductase [Chitinivibrionales bacterium]
MKTVKMGVIGVGGMGTSHARNIANNTKNVTLAAVCDGDAQKADSVAAELGCKAYHDSKTLIDSGELDAVLIATPHYSHTDIGVHALEKGLHVLVEKPISVHKADCERLIAAHNAKKQVFAAMFQQRTAATYRKVKQLIDGGELGELRRVNWIITSWFRTEAYYASGGWRATWKGEGGGVLLNQCPHNLDLLQWLCGMPVKVRAFCRFGQWHDIEVEDDVTAYMEFPNGATGVFVTTTGEAPGTNRLELCGENGKLVVEHGSLHFTRNEVPMSEFSRTSNQSFATPERWECEIPVRGDGGSHAQVIQNFIDAITGDAELIAPAAEGINSVELANAMLYSSIVDQTVELPLDGAVFERTLQKLIKESTFVKKTKDGVKSDLSASFNG